MRRIAWRATPWVCALALVAGCGGNGDGQDEVARLEQELTEAKAELSACRDASAGDTDGAQPVELASEAVGVPEDGAVIEVDLSETDMTLEGRKMTTAEPAREVRAAVAKDPSARVVITAAPDVEYQKLVEVLDAARVNGVKNLALGDQARGPAPVPQ